MFWTRHSVEVRCWTLISREGVIDRAEYDVAPTRTSSSRVGERLEIVAKGYEVIAKKPHTRWMVAQITINRTHG